MLTLTVPVGRRLYQPVLDLDFAGRKSLVPRIGPTPTFSRASTGMYWNSSGVLTSAAIDAPRFAHDPVTLESLGILMEEQRTNTILNSTSLAGSGWLSTPGDFTLTGGHDGPAGPGTAFRLYRNTSNTAAYRCQGTVPSAAPITFSVYLKIGSAALDARTFIVRNVTTAVNVIVSNINYETGTASGGHTMTAVGNGWWRLKMTATSGFSAGDSFWVYFGSGGAGAAGEFFYIYGPQMESGSFASSYIPTTSAAATRSADICTISGADFANLWSTAGGTLVGEALVPVAIGNGPGLWWANNGGTASRGIAARLDAGDVEIIARTPTGSNATSLGNFAYGTTPLRVAQSYDQNWRIAGSLNGAATVVVNTFTDTVPLDSLRIGHQSAGGTAATMSGTFKRLRYYREQLSDAKLQELTL